MVIDSRISRSFSTSGMLLPSSPWISSDRPPAVSQPTADQEAPTSLLYANLGREDARVGTRVVLDVLRHAPQHLVRPHEVGRRLLGEQAHHLAQGTLTLVGI